MKKVFKKISSVTLALSVLGGTMALASCGNKEEEFVGNGKSVKISAVALGYGVEWLENIVSEFQKDTGIKVYLDDYNTGEVGINALKTELESKSSTISDLIFNKFSHFARYVHEGEIRIGSTKYPCLLEDMTDVWTSVVDEGSSLTVADKMESEYSAFYNMGTEEEPQYYGMPWAGGVLGIVRNKTIWDSYCQGEEVPVTTDQLFTLCDKIVAMNKTASPFIFSNKQNYYESFSPIFMAQYDGKEAYTQFLHGVDPDGNITPDVYSYTGAMKSMEVMEKLINRNNKYQHSSSGSIDFTRMQSFFLSGQALFCVNGTWLENEMKQNYSSADIDYIRTPVISSIIDKLPTVNDDATLVQVIKYIDATDNGSTATKPTGVSDADIERVTEARHISYISGGIDHQVVIPSYAKNIEEAKTFLKYMYSDKGLDIYYKTMNGVMLPANSVKGLDGEGVNMSGFVQSSNEATVQGYSLNTQTTAKFFSLTGFTVVFNNGGSIVDDFYNGKLNAKGAIARNTTTISNSWETVKAMLGLTD